VAGIRAAFAGVRLGSGISLRQAQAADTWRDDAHTEVEWRALPRSEVTDDWAAVPEAELERDCTAYLDAEGLRYYLPALMLWFLDHYDEHRLFNEGASMALIGTTTALDQREPCPPGFLELLTPGQRRAVALYVRALPGLVELDHEDTARMSRAWRDVWSRELADGQPGR